LEPLYNDYRKLRRKLADGGQYMSFQTWFVGTLESGIDVVY
jgi:hypothetical protein